MGCASTPDVELGYYHARSEIEAEVTRTLTCSGGDTLVEASDVKLTTKHLADRKNSASINAAALSGWFADSNITLQRYSDGRLKGINTSTEGKGETILTSAVSLATSLLPAAGVAPAKQTEMQALCTEIGTTPIKNSRKVTPNTVVITYKTTMSVTNEDCQNQEVEPTSKSLPTRTKLANALTNIGAGGGGLHRLDDLIGKVDLNLTLGSNNRCHANGIDTSDRILFGADKRRERPGELNLEMRRTEQATVSVVASNNIGYTLDLEAGQSIEVAGQGLYFLPIPKAKLFGGNQFELEVEDNGAVTKIGYKTTSGAGQVFASGQAFDAATSGATYAEKAKEAKAKADLLAATQRIAVCQADPANCK